MTIKHVLLVTETYRPEINGVATTLGQWVDGMLNLGIRVTVVRPRQHNRDQGTVNKRQALNPSHNVESGSIQIDNQSAETQILVASLPIPGYSELKFGFASKAWFKKLLTSQKPDAVYIATEGPLGLSALRAAKEQSIRAISGFHTNFHSYSKFYNLGFLEPLIMRYLLWFHNTSSATLVPTAQQQALLQSKGFRNLHVVSRGIDSTLFSSNKRSESLRRSWGVTDKEPVFIYVGRIAAEKNLDLVAEAYKVVRAKYHKPKFVLVGDGPLKPELAARYPDLIFAGVQRGEALAQHYASGDIFLFPSKTDTFGNVVTEAMASGCCICAFDDAAAREHLKNRQSALLADLGDDEAFVNNALLAYEQHSLRQNLASGSKRIASNLSWREIVALLCRNFENASLPRS